MTYKCPECGSDEVVWFQTRRFDINTRADLGVDHRNLDTTNDVGCQNCGWGGLFYELSDSTRKTRKVRIVAYKGSPVGVSVMNEDNYPTDSTAFEQRLAKFQSQGRVLGVLTLEVADE